MEQSHFWKANSHSASQEIPPPFTETEGSLSCSQNPTTSPYTKPDEASPLLITQFLRDQF
jgi:hypothetical protein